MGRDDWKRACCSDCVAVYSAPDYVPAMLPRRRVGEVLREFGPGIVSGAANDDPSCIVSYAIAGAAFGYLTLWTSLYLLPVIATVQLLCARLGRATGCGIIGAARDKYRWAILPLSAGLAVANIVTIGADIGGMAEVTSLLTGAPPLLWAVIYAVGLTALLLFAPYRRIQFLFKWLVVALFTYVVAGIVASPDWREVTRSTLLPSIEWSREYLAVIVAILGATVSPYFLFWQASQQVEQDTAFGHSDHTTVDVLAGSFISKLITYFITLTSAAALHSRGLTEIRTAGDAASALAPAAGPAAYLLFAIGIIGTGALAIPVLAGSSAYAISEAMRWPASLDHPPRVAPRFYSVLFVSMVFGLVLIYYHVDVVQMLFWASVLNGLLAPVSILLIVFLTNNPAVMRGYVSGGWLKPLGWTSFAVSAAAALAFAAL